MDLEKKITWTNIKKFITGWFRYIIYKLSKFKFVAKVAEDLNLLSPHKVEQFKWRLSVMKSECLTSGACVICGCETPQLQMTNEACEGKCYPEMMDQETWDKYKEDNKIII